MRTGANRFLALVRIAGSFPSPEVPGGLTTPLARPLPCIGGKGKDVVTIADALTHRGQWPDSSEAPGREVLSWLVIAALLEGHAELGVVETHPGQPGTFDCLSVFDRTRLDRGPILDINRNGYAHIAPLDGGAAEWRDFWDVCGEEGPVTIAGHLRARARLGQPANHDGPEAFIVGQIARRLLKLHVAGIGGRWECRNGVEDSSLGDRRRIELFQQLPAAIERLAAAPPHPLGDQAFGFWFLLRDSVPVSCLDIYG